VSAEQFTCPKCGGDCSRDDADIGIGIIYGPWGCGNCGWSENPEYDISEGQKTTEAGGVIDQFGGITP
jgi:predicted nucleic-acid-binding Zn-ribbon protein